jgi:hypothetical protein
MPVAGQGLVEAGAYDVEQKVIYVLHPNCAVDVEAM